MSQKYVTRDPDSEVKKSGEIAGEKGDYQLRSEITDHRQPLDRLPRVSHPPLRK